MLLATPSAPPQYSMTMASSDSTGSGGTVGNRGAREQLAAGASTPEVSADADERGDQSKPAARHRRDTVTRLRAAAVRRTRRW